MELCTATFLAFAIGFCDPTTDYCPDPVGTVVVQQDWFCFGKNVKLQSEIVHFSEFGNGEPNHGDRGTEFYFPLKVQIKLF